jgi:hypothetical protein
MLDKTRLRNNKLFAKIVTPEQAAEMVMNGMKEVFGEYKPSAAY